MNTIRRHGLDEVALMEEVSHYEMDFKVSFAQCWHLVYFLVPALSVCAIYLSSTMSAYMLPYPTMMINELNLWT